MASLPENLTSLLGKTATGTATLIGSGISQYLASKGSKNRKKALFAVLAGNLLDLFDKKSMLSNIQGLQDFEDSNVDNLEYINQRGQRRKLLRDEVLQRGGELVADPTEENPEGYKFLNEAEMKNNWRLERTNQLVAQRSAQGLTGPFSDDLKKSILKDADEFLKNLKSRGDSYNWSRTDKGLADVYTKAQREAVAFYGKPTRQGAIGSWWGSKFGDDEERQAAIMKNQAVLDEINNWKKRDAQINNFDYNTSEQITIDVHRFNSDEIKTIMSSLDNIDLKGQKIGDYITNSQQNFSSMIKNGVGRQEAFLSVITDKMEIKEQIDYNTKRRLQKKILNDKIVKVITSDPENPKYQKLISSVNPMMKSIIETYPTLEPIEQESVLTSLRTTYDDFKIIDNRNDVDAMQKA